MVRLALVGPGRWGLNYVHAAEASGIARVTAIVRRGDNVVRAVGSDKIDAVVVATHPRDSVRVAVLAIAAGKPVLVEKPAGLSLRDAEQLADAAARARSLVLVGHQHLFSEGLERLRRRAEQSLDVCGEAMFGGPGPARDYPALWDYGPHVVSAAVALLGGNTFATTESDGAFVVVGDRGRMRCRVGAGWSKKMALVSNYGQGAYDGYAPAEPALTRQVRAFATAVRDGVTTDWRFGARWAVDAARLLEQAGGGRDGYGP